jgi:pilus assembly protein CpaD
MSKFVTRTASLALPLAAALLLSACASDDLALDDAYVPNAGSENYAIMYAKGPVSLAVDSSHGSLQPAQVKAVAGFARQSMAGGLTTIAISRPAGGGHSVRVAEEVAGVMVRQGIPAELIRIGTYPAPASAPVQLAYVKSYAHTKPCGDWSSSVSDTGKNQNMPNHGCAVQSNIAAMLADPEDVISPDVATDTHSAVGSAAIRRQQSGQAQTGFGSLFSIF